MGSGDMKEEQQQEPYLLDDREFARVMSYQYKKAGQPRDELTEQRVWNRLKGQSQRRSTRWFYSASALAAVAILLIFVLPRPEDKTLQQNPMPKTASPDTA